jgi:hypothetical protein
MLTNWSLKKSPVAGRQCRGSFVWETSALTPCNWGLIPTENPRSMPRSIDHRRAWGKSNRLIVFTSSSVIVFTSSSVFGQITESTTE